MVSEKRYFTVHMWCQYEKPCLTSGDSIFYLFVKIVHKFYQNKTNNV